MSGSGLPEQPSYEGKSINNANVPFNDKMECRNFYLFILPPRVPHVPKIIEIRPARRPQHLTKVKYHQAWAKSFDFQNQ